MQDLERDLVPPSQVTSQTDHTDHASYTPSTKRNKY